MAYISLETQFSNILLFDHGTYVNINLNLTKTALSFRDYKYLRSFIFYFIHLCGRFCHFYGGTARSDFPLGHYKEQAGAHLMVRSRFRLRIFSSSHRMHFSTLILRYLYI